MTGVWAWAGATREIVTRQISMINAEIEGLNAADQLFMEGSVRVHRSRTGSEYAGGDAEFRLIVLEKQIVASCKKPIDLR